MLTQHGARLFLSQGEPHEPDQKHSYIGSKLLLTAVHAYDLVKGLAFQQESWLSKQGIANISEVLQEMQTALKDYTSSPWRYDPCFSPQAWMNLPNLTSVLNAPRENGFHPALQLLQPQDGCSPQPQSGRTSFIGQSGLCFDWSDLYQNPQVRTYIEVLGGNQGNGHTCVSSNHPFMSERTSM